MQKKRSKTRKRERKRKTAKTKNQKAFAKPKEREHSSPLSLDSACSVPVTSSTFECVGLSAALRASSGLKGSGGPLWKFASSRGAMACSTCSSGGIQYPICVFDVLCESREERKKIKAQMRRNRIIKDRKSQEKKRNRELEREERFFFLWFTLLSWAIALMSSVTLAVLCKAMPANEATCNLGENTIIQIDKQNNKQENVKRRRKNV